MSKVHLRFFIIQFLLVILVLMAFLVRSVVNLTLVSESLNKDRNYSGSFYQLEEKQYDRSNYFTLYALYSYLSELQPC